MLIVTPRPVGWELCGQATRDSPLPTIAVDIGARDQQARAHAGLSRATGSSGDRAAAYRHLQRALLMYADLGMPQAGRLRAQVAPVGG